jgi:hypothetical protein
MVNLKSGETFRETYVADKDEYLNQNNKLPNFTAPVADSILLLEVRANSFSIWVNDKELVKNPFSDKEIGGDNVYVCVDFEATDGDTIHCFGYDELPATEPEYKPAPVVTPAAGGKKTPEKKPTPAKKDPKAATKPPATKK